MKNFEELTVAVLKEIAKEKGIKGAYKMRKAELVEALNNTEVKEVETMDAATTNKGLENNKEEVKEVVNMNNINFAELNKLTPEDRQVTLANIAAAAEKRNMMGFNIIKKESKNIRTINIIRAEFGVKHVNYGDRKVPEVFTDVFVQPAQESALLRACNIKTGKLADKVMVADGLYVDEIVTVSFAKSLLNKNKKIKKLFSKVMDSLFANPNVPFAVNQRKCLMLKFNTTTGVVTKVDTVGKLAVDEVVVEYEFMGITPSGLRSASIICAATKRHTNKNVINVDRRIALLEKAMDGAFSCNFLEANKAFKTLTSLEKLFKDSTRITQCAPGSLEVMDITNYVVAHNISANATFNGKAAESVTDGNVRVSTESLIDGYYREKGIPVSFSQVNGTCAQYRGASLKCSGTATKRRDVAMLAKMAIANDNIAFIVIDGVRYTRDEFLALSFEDRESFFANIDLFGDMNAFKLEEFNPVFKLVKLKEAYSSASDSNMVVNMAMMQVAPEEAREFLIRRAKEQLCEKFRKLGANFNLNENGMPIPESFGFEVTDVLNNAPQFIDYLFNCDRKTIMMMLPAILRSVLSNEVKGIRKLVNELKVDLNSVYSVVQSDMAALFGETILAEDECFCKDFTVEEVSAVRHPISSIFAVTSFKVVSLEEVLNRIDKLNVGASIKNSIADFYAFAKGYVILPASEYLMEKHDGMDWDIDAMQFILDQEAVNILKRLPNIGSSIPKEHDWMRKTTLNGERNISEKIFVRPEFELTAPTKSDANDMSKAFNKVSNTVSYTYDFNNVGKYVARAFFSSDVANVGEIATAFYNNVCILSALISNKTDEVIKAAIVKEFNDYYKCSGKTMYKSVIVKVEEDGKIVYESNKFDCCEAIFRFAESNGSIEELCEFLMDCIYLNRYLAETSIDAAKNRFFIMNMFNHADFVRALGSDKNMNIVVTEEKEQANAIYAERFSTLGLGATDMDSNNFFNIEMLTAKKKGVALENLEAARQEAADQAYLTGREPKAVALAVADPLASIRNELSTFANDLIVLYTKLAEKEVTSLEGIATREYVINAAEQLENQKEINDCLFAVNNAYSAITTCAKEVDTFEDKAAKDYMNTVAVQSCRNMANLALSGVDAYSIGLCAVALMSKEDGTGTINPAILKVFEREIISFLSTLGIKNVGMIGETLMYAKKDGRLVKLENYIGLEVAIESGKAYLEDGTVIVAKNKKANIKGIISKTEYGFAIIGERKYAEDDLSVGAYFAFRANKDNAKIIGLTNCKGEFIPVEYGFRTQFTVNNKTYYNILTAYNAEGQYKIIGDVTANSNIAATLESMDLNTNNFKVFTSGKGKIAFFLGGAECQAILSAINTDSDFEGEYIAPELDTDLDNNEFFFDVNEEFGLPQ